MLSIASGIDKIWSFDSLKGFFELIKLGSLLRKQKFDLVYDAHSNIRSRILRLILLFSFKKYVKRSKQRYKRFLLFNFRKNLFTKPYKASQSFLAPLYRLKLFKNLSYESININFDDHISKKVEQCIRFNNYVVIAPSAAWKKKRWPIDKWEEVILKSPNLNFVILGGKEDIFCQKFEEKSPKNVQNLCGEINLIESFYVIKKSKCIVSGDTGMIHMADLLNHPGVLLIGPTAFGETSSPNIKILKSDLSCMPCSKDGSGGCSQDIYQKCMKEISSKQVLALIEQHA